MFPCFSRHDFYCFTQGTIPLPAEASLSSEKFVLVRALTSEYGWRAATFGCYSSAFAGSRYGALLASRWPNKPDEKGADKIYLTQIFPGSGLIFVKE
ncbi:MAG: hypothetical protein AAFP99_09565 [Pseudomonadota bacterium]